MADPKTPAEIREAINGLQAKLTSANRPILQGMADAIRSNETVAMVANLQDGASNFDPNSQLAQTVTSAVTMLRNLGAAIDREITALGPETTAA